MLERIPYSTNTVNNLSLLNYEVLIQRVPYNQRLMNDSQRTRLSCGRMIQLLANPFPPLPSTSCLPFSQSSCVAGRRGVGEEPNHTTARKPGHLLIIQYSGPQSRQSAKRFSSRLNWDSPTPLAAGECAPPPFGTLWCSTYIYISILCSGHTTVPYPVPLFDYLLLTQMRALSALRRQQASQPTRGKYDKERLFSVG